VGSLLLAMALRSCLTCTAALSAFWTQRANGAVSLTETLLFLLGGMAAPLALLPGAAGAVPGVLLVQAGWLLLLAGLLGLVWRRGIRRFTAVGG
jgi:ABC-2 type transport system permease protein